MPESCFPQLPLATCTGNPPGTTSKIQVASGPWTPGAHVAMNQASNSAIHCRRRWRADGGIQWRAIGSGTAQSTADPDMSLPRDRTRWRFPTRLSPIWQVALHGSLQRTARRRHWSVRPVQPQGEPQNRPSVMSYKFRLCGRQSACREGTSSRRLVKAEPDGLNPTLPT
ncbi:hypothetical protein ACCO45_007505 [Purpureocillium lilacinum]|uniref:Uncharacterized protein n=1 Tax=Purpureocillium lilacinum TaxID=33203 RepID=A0ACC4DTJ5_PURLI